jgi:alkanesulfonate monooxygenase SsuD/methylene tetrahydromethanopterin reductase-like flavin-dependent oxidoreductase (luciferase family)
MTHNAERNSTASRRDSLVLGVTVRTLGAWPGGWRSPGAHRDPTQDPAALRTIATAVEAAGLDFLFFGDWLATAPEFEHTDPSLLARIEPFAAISYLAAITDRIGLITTTSSAHSEPYAVARAIASADLLSNGRVGLSVATGSEPRTDRNFGQGASVHNDDRYASAAEFTQILRGLWDSWSDDAFVSNSDSGQLINHHRLRPLNFVGRFRASAGPLNTVRPPQGHPPIAAVVTSTASHDFAAREADIAFVSPKTLADGVTSATALRQLVARAGRSAGDLVLIAPILPIVGDTPEHAWQAYDRLADLVLLADAANGDPASGAEPVSGIPAGRDTRALAGILGVPLAGVELDDVVPVRTAARFGGLGQDLLAEVTRRSGRSVGAVRPTTFRHLLVAHIVAAPVVVGTPTHIADHLEAWFAAGAVDGFTVLPAYTGEQLDLFLDLVVPALRHRGLVGVDDAASPPQLRHRLGLDVAPTAGDHPIDTFEI